MAKLQNLVSQYPIFITTNPREPGSEFRYPLYMVLAIAVAVFIGLLLLVDVSVALTQFVAMQILRPDIQRITQAMKGERTTPS